MLISICIPTYNSGDKIVRLLNSIKTQTYKAVEVIISDDSKDNKVFTIVNDFNGTLNIKYYHNNNPLGTPSNWNNAVSKCTGQWINLMHHDDWFADNNSLQKFVDIATSKPTTTLIFSAFQNNYLDLGTKKKFFCSKFEIWLLKQNYLNLYKTFLPNPSCTLINASYKPYEYDAKFKWLIDFDFFTTLFKQKGTFFYIDEALVNVGMHSQQVTASVVLNPKIEIPETIGLLNKYGSQILNNIFVFDFYWRMYRNLNVRSMPDFNNYLGYECSYKNIINIINFQKKIKPNTLKIGVLSKFFAAICYIQNYQK